MIRCSNSTASVQRTMRLTSRGITISHKDDPQNKDLPVVVKCSRRGRIYSSGDRGDRMSSALQGCFAGYFDGKYFSHILSRVDRIRFRFGSNSPNGIRGSVTSILLARFWSILEYSTAYSWATLSDIPSQ